MTHNGFMEKTRLQTHQGCKIYSHPTRGTRSDLPVWPHSPTCLNYLTAHHKLIWSKVLSEGEDVVFFLADKRHTLMSRASIGREGESIFAFQTTFEFFAHLCFDRVRMRQLFENFALTPFTRATWEENGVGFVPWKLSRKWVAAGVESVEA